MICLRPKLRSISWSWNREIHTLFPTKVSTASRPSQHQSHHNLLRVALSIKCQLQVHQPPGLRFPYLQQYKGIKLQPRKPPSSLSCFGISSQNRYILQSHIFVLQWLKVELA